MPRIATGNTIAPCVVTGVSGATDELKAACGPTAGKCLAIAAVSMAQRHALEACSPILHR